MKIVLEILLVITLVAAGVYASVSDIKHGIIKNRVLAVFFGIAVLLDGIYYGFAVRDIAVEFLISYFIVAALAMILFFTNCWAGGDCKLSLVLGLLFPARLYVAAWETNITLFLSLVIAFLFGYGFLIVDAVYGLITRRDRISLVDFKRGSFSFFKYYIAAVAYLIAFDLLYRLVIARYIIVDSPIVSLFGFAIALATTSIKPLMKCYVFLPVLLVDIVLCIIFKIFPLSQNALHYVIVLLLAVFRILISARNYISIRADSIKPGMILSTASSVVLAHEIPKAEIQISTEKLDSRLTEDQADKIATWGERKDITIAIVRRIPFAAFISLGFLVYLIWGGLAS